MAKKVLVISLIAIFLMSSMSYADDPIKKLGRGIANMLTFPLELPKGIGDANREDGPLAAASYGVLKGLFDGCVRGIVGVYETVTFLIPIPADYAPIVKDPEFFLEGLF